MGKERHNNKGRVEPEKQKAGGFEDRGDEEGKIKEEREREGSCCCQVERKRRRKRRKSGI